MIEKIQFVTQNADMLMVTASVNLRETMAARSRGGPRETSDVLKKV
jgi:Holliday junction resolvasome RuvABC ATP-dependent DNA helicase subunit